MVEKKKHQVQRMFEEIAGIYDLGNHLLSLGQDFFWRKRVAEELKSLKRKEVLDLASGTADLAIAILQRNPEANVMALDFARKMLELGAEKSRKKGLDAKIAFIGADLEQMPFLDESFEVATIAFGLRNLEHRDKALVEIFRVLKPGGIFAVLEFHLPASGIFSKIYQFYLRIVLPRLGKILGGKSAYFYLRDTIQEFALPAQLLEEFKKAGFRIIKFFPLSQGIVYFYLAEKNKIL